MDQTIKLIILAVVLVPVCYAAISDLQSFRIPNWTSIVIAAPFAIYAPLFLTWQATLTHLLLALVVFAISFVYWMRKLFGGGDLKLLSAVCLWPGPDYILLLMLVLVGAAMVLVVILMWLQKKASAIEAMNVPAFVKRLTREALLNHCPYGLPIAIAALTVLPPAIMR